MICSGAWRIGVSTITRPAANAEVRGPLVSFYNEKGDIHFDGVLLDRAGRGFESQSAWSGGASVSGTGRRRGRAVRWFVHRPARFIALGAAAGELIAAKQPNMGDTAADRRLLDGVSQRGYDCALRARAHAGVRSNAGGHALIPGQQAT
jgi:hypothetical protein